MLLLATAVFTYYSVWTLLMVSYSTYFSKEAFSNPYLAIRRPRSINPASLPTSRVGHPHTSYHYSSRMCCRWNILECGDDQQQQEEGSQGEARSNEEEGLSWRQREIRRRAESMCHDPEEALLKAFVGVLVHVFKSCPAIEEAKAYGVTDRRRIGAGAGHL